jgi:ZIP family zinc transporter
MTTLILVSIATLISTFVGGLFAMRFRDKLHIILGFSAGAVIAVAFFDLIPEAIEIGSKHYSISTLLTMVALGFIIYLVLDRTIFLHGHEHEGENGEMKVIHKNGLLGASTLCIHSLFDGMAIGFAFQVSTAIGVVVAIAVLVHDFSDGINTVNYILKDREEKSNVLYWLIADAFAPVVGIVITLFVTVSEQYLAIIFSLFAGFFLYLGASDLIPESHHAHPKFMTTFMTLLGVIILFIVIQLSQL